MQMERRQGLLRNSYRAISLSCLHGRLSERAILPDEKTLWQRRHEQLKLPSKVTTSAFLHQAQPRCSHTHLPGRHINTPYRSTPTFSNTYRHHSLHIRAHRDLITLPTMGPFPTYLTLARPRPLKSCTNGPVKPPQLSPRQLPVVPVFPHSADPGQPKKRTLSWLVSTASAVRIGPKSSPCSAPAEQSTNRSKTAIKSN
jgi:hypothetical protein